MTGTAVGLVSVIGYTPDVYIAAVAGFLIDQSPGLAGFQHLFMLLLGFSVVGAIAAIAFERQARAASVTPTSIRHKEMGGHARGHHDDGSAQ